MSTKYQYFAEQFTDFPRKYFDGYDLEYPDPTQTMLELGLWHTYISSTFLNGWINYVKPIAASLITRYQGHSKNLEQVQKFHGRETPDFGGHTVLGNFGDDVLLALLV